MIYLGETGLKKTWQQNFPKTVECFHCAAEARIAFVYHEDGRGYDGRERLLCDLVKSDDKMWIHDCCAVAVYFCPNCLKVTSIMNQA